MSGEQTDKIWDKICEPGNFVIQASAGTGKTYALERVVLKLVTHGGFDIASILLVTYTEKAAGELKDRIRRLIESEYENPETPADDKQKLFAAISDFNSATISTIHSFCRSVLAEYAFENGQTMAFELDNSGACLDAAYDQALFSCELRNDFPISGTLDPIAVAYRFCLGSVRGGDDMLKSGISRADFDNGDTVAIFDGIPNGNKEFRRGQNCFADVRSQLISAHNKIRASIKCGNPNVTLQESMTKILNKAGRDLLSGFFGLFEKETDDTFFLLGFFNCWHGAEISENIYKKNFTDTDIKEKITRGLEMVSMIYNYCAEYAQFWFDRFCEIVVAKEKVIKRKAGVVGYDDMITMVRNALLPGKKNPNAVKLLNLLRMRYRAALVDEFQDTDPAQWEIFSRIFTNIHDSEYADCPDKPADPGKIIAVGDPKQSIYAFRGADVETFFRAKNELLKCSDGKNTSENLDVTYRCTNEMCDAFNIIFGVGSWFGEEEGFGYIPVKCPENNPKRISIRAANGERPAGKPLRIVDLESADAVTKAARYECFCRCAVSEIERLLKSDYMIFDALNPEGRRLNASDFCILVSRRNDARNAERYLKEKRIPYTFYKEFGIYSSVESESVTALLDFVGGLLGENVPPQQLLLSDFFDVCPTDLAKPFTDKFESIFNGFRDKWRELASAGRWAELFRSALYDTGLAYRLTADEGSGAVKFAAFTQIFDSLLRRVGDGSTAEKYTEALRRLRLSTSEEEGLRNRETDREAVKIMTMHASKGLEFPVVFLLGGDEEIKGLDTKNINRTEGRLSRVFSVNAAVSDSKLEKLGRRAAKCLMYVAMTRAEYLLYVMSPLEKNNPRNEKKASGTFLRDGINKLREHRELFEEIRFGEYCASAVSSEIKNAAATDESAVPDIFVLPQMRHHKFDCDSFSDIESRLEAGKYQTLRDLPPERVLDDEPAFETEDRHLLGTRTCLPPGALSGTVFHEIMEALCSADSAPDFASVGNCKTFENVTADTAFGKLVSDIMERHGLRNLRIRETAKPITEFSDTITELQLMAWRALSAPLDALNGARLADVPKYSRYAELEFYFSEPDVLFGDNPNANTKNCGCSLMTGFIDLLFKVDNKYYILDWKTNVLDNYNARAIADKMTECGYGLQYGIYSLAVERWLRGFLGADSAVGGSLYMFVRGAGVPEFSAPGLFFDGWNRETLAKTREKVIRSLREARNHERM